MSEETVLSRFRKVLRGPCPADRLPVIEWATWWDQTLTRWQAEGLPSGLDGAGVKRHFGLDLDYQLWLPQFAPDAPDRPLHARQHWVEGEADYDELRPYLYPDPMPFDETWWRGRAAEQEAGEAVLWITLSGFFWWPRVLLGIEPHLYAFFDQPRLLHRINEDQTEYLLKCLNRVTVVGRPEFATFAEDMSYNHGPMLSEQSFMEFLAPYYRTVVPRLKALDIVPIVDSDGDVEPLIPWLEAVGLRGILPLERMAGVDVNRIRANHPEWIMIGGFDKTVMHLGEAAMRAEFTRLLPAMRSGRYLPSVDHQTPPAVSVEDYRLYVRLLGEYVRKAVAISSD